MADRFVSSITQRSGTGARKAETSRASAVPASKRRFVDRRERRHREQAVAAWLRSLGR